MISHRLTAIRAALRCLKPVNDPTVEVFREICGELCAALEDIDDHLAEIDARANSAANTASCLANGIYPD